MTRLRSLTWFKIIQAATGASLVGPKAFAAHRRRPDGADTLSSTGTEPNVELRGVAPQTFLPFAEMSKSIEGTHCFAGSVRTHVGKNAKAPVGLTLGSTIGLGSVRGKVVGHLDEGGSAFDSEVWGAAQHQKQALIKRPDIFLSPYQGTSLSPAPPPPPSNKEGLL